MVQGVSVSAAGVCGHPGHAQACCALVRAVATVPATSTSTGNTHHAVNAAGSKQPSRRPAR